MRRSPSIEDKMQNKITPENITRLKPNEIFVFGSNYDGRHGKGAALTALKKFGAKPGHGVGLMGQSYGLATVGHRLKKLGLEAIDLQVHKFLRCAASHPDLEFLVTQVGCGLAGHKVKDIAPMFFKYGITENVSLPECFYAYKTTEDRPT
jgi:hypothetical protein